MLARGREGGGGLPLGSRVKHLIVLDFNLLLLQFLSA